MLEIASRSTGRQDAEWRRERPTPPSRIPEYWRFDETGEFHGTRLAGDRLAGGRVRGDSRRDRRGRRSCRATAAVLNLLNLLIRWDHGQLGWHDPETGQHIATFEQERARADNEREARMAAEARVSELEAELEQHRQG